MVDLPWLFPIKRSESDIRKITMGNNLERKYMITRRTDSIKSKMFNKYQWLSRAATFEVSSEGYWSSYSQPKKLLSGSSYSNDIYDFGFHTRSKDFDQKPDKAPYIIIDLKKQAHVRGVLVHNRQNLQYRANGLTVWISKNKENWVEVGKAAEVHSEWGVETDGKGRYVKLGFTDKRSEAFHLRSVWIFGSFL